MKKTVVAILVAIILTGCETVEQTSNEVAQKMGVSNAGSGATLGAALGCAGGAVLGYATGVGAGKGCVAGAVVGGATGYLDGRQRDLDDAKKLAQELSPVNSSVTGFKEAEQYVPKVETQEVEVQQKDKPNENVTAFKSITVPIPLGSIHDHSPAVKTTLGKIGRFAASRSTDTVIMVTATKNDRIFIEDELNQGIDSAQSKGQGTEFGTEQKKTMTHIRFVNLKKGEIPKITVSPGGVNA